MQKEELNVCVRRVSWNEGGRGGWTEGRTFLIIHVLILSILKILCHNFPVFNARSCFYEFFLSSSMTKG